MKFVIIPNMTRENAHSVTTLTINELLKLNCQVFMDLSLENVFDGLEKGEITLNVNGEKIPLVCSYTKRQIDILRAGGLLAYTKGE